MKTGFRELLNQLNRKYMNKNPQVAAVTQTLAGERLTQTITFPTTGDADCDLIQGVLAVINSMGDTYGDRVALVLRYLADRFTANERNQAQDVSRNHELSNLVRRQETLERQMGALEQQNRLYPKDYNSASGPMGGPISPHTTSSAPWMAGIDGSAPVCPPQMNAIQASDELEKFFQKVQNSQKP